MNGLIPLLRQRLADAELRVVNAKSVISIQKRQTRVLEDRRVLAEVTWMQQVLADIAGKAAAGRKTEHPAAKDGFMMDIGAMAKNAHDSLLTD